MELLEKEFNKKTQMETIRAGLFQQHPPENENDEFCEAIYALLNEFCDDYYVQEWDRIDDNETVYQGRHWENTLPEKEGDPRANMLPKPTTPIITSTIENLKADLSDDFPEATIQPDGVGNEVSAKVLTAVIAEELEECGFEESYDKIVHDLLNCGWGVWEVGYDPDANNGIGGTYIRYIVNKNFLCDPQTPSLQDGRAVFKIDKRPKDWFLQHYPDIYPYMDADFDRLGPEHDTFDATTTPAFNQDYRLIEAWFRIYDPKTKKHTVHFVRLSGGKVLENSALTNPNGYYKTGQYPFIIARLFPQKGSALGLGITDLFKEAQRYSDKLDQIVMTNAFRASRPRVFVQEDMCDIDDFRDFSNEVIETKGPPSSVMQWQQPAALPAYIINYIQIIQESIKQESGSNDQSRGQTGSGVTAASAITALQEMSTKRSRMEGRALHRAFRQAVRMQIEIMREMLVAERNVIVTVQGEKVIVPFSRKFLRAMGDGKMPIEHYITVKTARQTKYTRMMHNELLLQMLQILGNTVDPVIMMEGLQYDGLEPLLDNVKKAQNGGMLALQKQVAQLSAVVEQLTEERDGYRDSAEQLKAAVLAQGQTAEQPAAQTLSYGEVPAGMAQNLSA